ncbi:MAG TPA: hypothetical protein PL078_04145 [Bacillota bacterium]|jgi:hypothetical protein|nr:hypothetical protein [Peptococcaceae bacterium MAG4]NLW37487.1 hypothetical protein [Peptococcaceae bacterium]HPU36026.1 hypothetical protein [Bacillota bacterium]HPZ43177.1 hypothetical protein [Bacillota bacterium]HQD75722.1 hypothetical protein [Bacillota bacterium]
MRSKKSKVTLLVLVAAVVSLVFWGYSALAGAEDTPGGSGDPLVTQSYVDQYVQWKVAEMKAGQVLTGRAGSEILVRRGQAVVVDTSGNGIPDVTAGQDLKAGSKISLNHLLVIPREDGRGIKALDSVVVMYKGGATIR